MINMFGDKRLNARIKALEQIIVKTKEQLREAERNNEWNTRSIHDYIRDHNDDMRQIDSMRNELASKEEAWNNEKLELMEKIARLTQLNYNLIIRG